MWARAIHFLRGSGPLDSGHSKEGLTPMFVRPRQLRELRWPTRDYTVPHQKCKMWCWIGADCTACQCPTCKASSDRRSRVGYFQSTFLTITRGNVRIGLLRHPDELSIRTAHTLQSDHIRRELTVHYASQNPTIGLIRQLKMKSSHSGTLLTILNTTYRIKSNRKPPTKHPTTGISRTSTTALLTL